MTKKILLYALSALTLTSLQAKVFDFKLGEVVSAADSNNINKFEVTDMIITDATTSEVVVPTMYTASYAIQAAGAIYALYGIKQLVLDTEKKTPKTTADAVRARIAKIEKEKKVWAGFGIYLIGCIAQIIVERATGLKKLDIKSETKVFRLAKV